MEVREIKIDSVEVVENVRVSAKDAHLVELMDSIKQHGLLQPIGVTPTASGKHVLVYGQRRLLACGKLGWKKIPAVIGGELELKDHLLANITENLQRKGNTPMELGRICVKLMGEYKMTVGELASRLSVSQHLIKASLETYRDVPMKLRERIKFMAKGESKNGNISATVVSQIMGVGRKYGLTTEQRGKILEVTQQQELSTDDIGLIGLLLKYGLTPVKAIKMLKEYRVFNVSMVINVEEAEKLCKKYECSLNNVFSKIVYGEIPALKKPEFLKD